jgi:hypothetical protein
LGEASAIAGAVVAALFALAGGLGAWRWYRVETSHTFWVLLRVAQAALVGYVVLVGVLLASGRRPDDDLFYVYALLPVAISFVGEQLRIAAADTVLSARGLPDAQAVGRLDEAGQRSVVTAILRRELGVMALAALVIAGMLVRAATSA